MTDAAIVREKTTGPVGIGGWLYLVMLGFAGTILMTGANLIGSLQEADGLKAILAATDGPLVQLKAPLALNLLSGVAVMASAAYCLFLILAKRKRIINMATAHYLILLFGSLMDLWTDAAARAVSPTLAPDPSIYTEVIRALVIAAIWIPYFHVSKRVRNTCVNP
jgi:hypothetical protein